MSKKIVTIKLPRNPLHDPHHKVTGKCPLSDVCTDMTGEHHTGILTEDQIATLRADKVHITRIEDIREGRL